ncbi:hypothetical protein CDAR_523191 [Caerostris darwini]|uniref:Uncharacterized protein n=1 Tax=Caerostris darwini TaxID=1538125 RepID=A0AAV4U978_9ARAC|nr:hypothetical protein CDAR_523191 [Caerostris darwini]
MGESSINLFDSVNARSRNPSWRKPWNEKRSMEERERHLPPVCVRSPAPAANTFERYGTRRTLEYFGNVFAICVRLAVPINSEFPRRLVANGID